MKVYEEWDSTLVECGHGPNIRYRVFYGTVNWKRTTGGMEPAFTVLMQYGTTEEWAEAKSEDEISFDMPAHILKNDLPAVNKALQEIAERNGVAI